MRIGVGYLGMSGCGGGQKNGWWVTRDGMWVVRYSGVGYLGISGCGGGLKIGLWVTRDGMWVVRYSVWI